VFGLVGSEVKRREEKRREEKRVFEEYCKW